MTKETRRKPLASGVGISRFADSFALCAVSQSTERKAYKYRFYPTEDQAREPAQTFGCVRYVYNGALALQTQAWFERHERIDSAETDRPLMRMKKEPKTSWLAEVSCVPLQQALRHLNADFVNFFAGRAPYWQIS